MLGAAVDSLSRIGLDLGPGHMTVSWHHSILLTLGRHQTCVGALNRVSFSVVKMPDCGVELVFCSHAMKGLRPMGRLEQYR